MIEEISIRNFKSIAGATLALGNVNVFVGANGAGKSNILEAVGMAAAVRYGAVEVNDMVQKGVRIARPELMKSSFYGQAGGGAIEVEMRGNGGEELKYTVENAAPEDIYSAWKVACSAERMDGLRAYVSRYVIYSLSVSALRGVTAESLLYPLGINGEGLDVFLNSLGREEIGRVKEAAKEYVDWMEDVFFDSEERYKMQGYKLGRSQSNLYFRDRFMQRKNNLFSAENVNEGALELLFYLALFVSRKTPDFFAVDNIENGLNPRLCRYLVGQLAALAAEKGKQVLITTHNPAVLDGLNLHDDRQRLFVVSRNDEGQTQVRRVETKGQAGERRMMLSEMWMKGLIGGVPDNF